MPDEKIPDDPIKLQRAYDEAQAEVDRVAAAMPSAVSTLDREQPGFTEEESAALHEARARRDAIALRLVVACAPLDHEAREAVRAAARVEQS
ncbi:hypothetical protein ACQEU3_46905 [Spirillospora sp. CA-253888]